MQVEIHDDDDGVTLVDAFSVSVIQPSANFDADLDTDGADFLAWQRGFGITGSANKSDGDTTADGAVNGADLSVWQSAFGLGALEASTTGAQLQAIVSSESSDDSASVDRGLPPPVAQASTELAATSLATENYTSDMPANVWLELPAVREPAILTGRLDSKDESATSSWAEQVDTALDNAFASPLPAASRTGGYAYVLSSTIPDEDGQRAADAIFSAWDELESAL